MSYVPPHLRKNASAKANTNTNANTKANTNTNANTNTKANMNTKEEFPALGKTTKQEPCTMDFKKLFEKRRELKKRRKMKQGWICMSKNGVIDSMTPEQRENDRKYYEEQRINMQLDKFIARVERDIEIRMEYEDLSPEELQFSSSSEEESEESELEVQEDEEIDDRF
jgi:hypothetical protein